MSVTSKSPLDVLVTAWAVAKQALPAYRHVNSPKKFTQHQLFACLVLKNFQRLDYRGITEQLLDCPSLTEAIELDYIPHYTTLQKAAQRLLACEAVQSLLDETVAMQMGRRKRVPEAAIDSTGLEATCASAYFVRRRKTKDSPWKTVVYQRYPKLSLVSDVRTHFILAYRVGKGPRPDVDEFQGLIDQASKRVRLHRILADAGYDSEPNHQFARDKLHLRTIIPAKHGRPTDKPASGRYRRLMQLRFDHPRYRQRSQVETVMSMIKRRQGNFVRGKTDHARHKELHLMVLTHNVMILWWA
ncbi:transposase [Bremerella sp.]|uniref:transposase n=1 Tax=Bremerella sp. TaxID=2795602 RepID=UPI00391C3996